MLAAIIHEQLFEHTHLPTSLNNSRRRCGINFSDYFWLNYHETIIQNISKGWTSNRLAYDTIWNCIDRRFSECDGIRADLGALDREAHWKICLIKNAGCLLPEHGPKSIEQSYLSKESIPSCYWMGSGGPRFLQSSEIDPRPFQLTFLETTRRPLTGSRPGVDHWRLDRFRQTSGYSRAAQISRVTWTLLIWNHQVSTPVLN